MKTVDSNQYSANRGKGRFAVCCFLFAIHLSLVTSVFAAESSSGLEDQLKTYMQDNYPWTIIEISNIRTSGDMPTKAPDNIKVIRGPLGNAVFSFGFKNEHSITVEAGVTAFDSIVKSQRSLSRGHVVTDEDIYAHVMDITRIPVAAVRDSEEIIGRPLKRSINANIPITGDMIEKSQIVKKGSKVTLLIEGRGLSIATSGKLKEKGFVGETVKAANMLSMKEVSGVLIDENTVKVEF